MQVLHSEKINRIIVTITKAYTLIMLPKNPPKKLKIATNITAK